MKVATETKVETLGDYAYEAIQKHFKKTLKWEKAVKKDEDPEALHQMRVGMRRLRTAISRFGIALNLSKPANDKNIGKIARRLGNLRDLDVLKETLETTYQPNLPQKEQKTLQKAFDALSKQRESALEKTLETLKDESYKSLKQTLEDWLEKPSYQPLASLPIKQVLPDLLLPEVSTFLLHPGLLVGTHVVESEVKIRTDWKADKVEEQLTTKGETIHSLRKQAKRVRYQMELFTELYSEAYAAYITEVKSIQDILGNIQDSMVMGEWLVEVFKSELNDELPTLAKLVAENRFHWWQQWQPLQEKYLTAENRHNFHMTILQPV
ncbi:CHAD domain-containing protein [Anabaena azotica]|uniref:CHAD domain-containing protein n=1 Tax=Anabaena azotica FACHB-119 TaxID=947527 RepID=A0ABR8DBE6_9NOST|nr:CHAD domain-containing protein [Anabaena azotica]MBD2503527.1 CHAD domain-containing protein [Anabaena azotica FACHB-119]